MKCIPLKSCVVKNLYKCDWILVSVLSNSSKQERKISSWGHGPIQNRHIYYNVLGHQTQRKVKYHPAPTDINNSVKMSKRLLTQTWIFCTTFQPTSFLLQLPMHCHVYMMSSQPSRSGSISKSLWLYHRMGQFEYTVLIHDCFWQDKLGPTSCHSLVLHGCMVRAWVGTHAQVARLFYTTTYTWKRKQGRIKSHFPGFHHHKIREAGCVELTWGHLRWSEPLKLNKISFDIIFSKFNSIGFGPTVTFEHMISGMIMCSILWWDQIILK